MLNQNKISGLWFFFVPLADWFCACRQVGFIGRYFLDINSLALETQINASISFRVNARLGQLAQSEL